MLPHDAIRSPRGQRVIESLVCRSYSLLIRERHSSVVEVREIADPVVGRGRHYPGIAPFTQDMTETIIVLEQERRLGGQGSFNIVPVDRICEIDIEVGDHRPSCQNHVSWGGKIRLLNVLQLADESLLRRTTRTGIPLDRPLIDHDREGEAGMRLSFCHHQLRGLINAVVGAVPIDDDAVNSPADHVGDLPMDLLRIRGVVADIHVVRASEPQQQVCVHLCASAGIEQAVNIDLAHVPGRAVAIALG